MMMKNSLLLAALLCTNAFVVDATPTPQIAKACTTKSCPAVNKASFGGVPKRAFTVRGGEVFEAHSMEEMEAILIKSPGTLVVIDHWASWCGPCKMIAPLFQELSEQVDNVVFVKVDVDENPDTAAKYSVSAMPTFVFVKDGEVVDRLMGANPTRLQELIEEHA